MTRGTASEPGLPVRKVQAGCRRVTFEALIWRNGEKRMAPGSLPKVGQSDWERAKEASRIKPANLVTSLLYMIMIRVRFWRAKGLRLQFLTQPQADFLLETVYSCRTCCGIRRGLALLPAPSCHSGTEPDPPAMNHQS